MELRVKNVCRAQGVTLAEVASKIGVAQASLSKMLGGNPTVGTLEKVANALDVPITELFDAGAGDELTALVQYKGDFYKATTIAELEEVVSRIKDSRHDDK